MAQSRHGAFVRLLQHGNMEGIREALLADPHLVNLQWNNYKVRKYVFAWLKDYANSQEGHRIKRAKCDSHRFYGSTSGAGHGHGGPGL